MRDPDLSTGLPSALHGLLLPAHQYVYQLEQDYVADEFRKFAAKYDEGKVPAVPEKE